MHNSDSVNAPTSTAHEVSEALARRGHAAVRRGRVVSNAVTRFSGSMTFVALHAAWFTVWIVLNLSLGAPFDPFPFGLLTLIVSLEAIFLSTFVLISQNQSSDNDSKRDASDFKTDVYAKVIAELTANKLGVTEDEISQAYRRQMAQIRDNNAGTNQR